MVNPVKMHPKILLWNARGIYSKLSEFKNYVYKIEPLIICLTETHLKTKYSLTLKNYQILRKDRTDGYGGLVVFFHNSVTFRNLSLSFPQNLNINMEYISSQYKYDNLWYTLILLYNPCKNIKEEEFSFFLDQVENGIICGDLNAHHQSWESSSLNPNFSGKSLFSSLNCSSNLTLLNPIDMTTRIDPHSGKSSNIDMVIGSSAFNSHILINGVDLGSDHLPILLCHQEKNNLQLYFRPKWLFKDEAWTDWNNKMIISTPIYDPNRAFDENYCAFRDTITEVSNSFFKITDSSKPKPPGKPWWNDLCERTVQARREALKEFKRCPNATNKSRYNLTNRRAKEVCRISKSEAWTNYLKTIGPRTPLTEVWKFFNSMLNKSFTSSIPLSDESDNPVDSYESAIILAEQYLINFSHSHHLTPEQWGFVEQSFLKGDQSGMNSDISLPELEKALNSTPARSSPGNDMIHNRFLIKLPKNQREILLKLFNSSFRTAAIPEDWKISNIIPIPKSGKDPTSPASYRPISLLSCVGKIMERIINKRLQWFIESHDSLLPQQFGFRPMKSTIDALIILEHAIQKSFRTEKITLVVFLDLKAAFDRASPKAIIFKLAKIGLTGDLLKWLNQYLENRKFSVCIKNKKSPLYPIISSVPQGSVLSPSLFNILVSDMPQTTEVQSLVYADDITFYTTASDMNEAKTNMQKMLNLFELWSEKWGLQICPDKSNMSYFTMKKLQGRGPILQINGTTIPYHPTPKLLGIILDSPSLTWRPQINNLLIKSQKRLNMMRCLAGSNNGITRAHLKTFYEAYIKSVLDYGLPVYTSAAPTNLKN